MRWRYDGIGLSTPQLNKNVIFKYAVRFGPLGGSSTEGPDEGLK